MSARIVMVSRAVAAALMAAAVALPVQDARAHGSSSWRDDDGPRQRHHEQHERKHQRQERHHHVAPRPRVFYVPPPHVVYLAPPHRHRGHRVAAHPVSPVYVARSGQYCRDYRASLPIGGVIRIGGCTACLHRDGVWRIVG